MNIRNLETFVCVAQCKSFSRASASLYISQPAISQQIQKMEQELGFHLLERNHHHVNLTPAGMIFEKRAQEILQIYHSAEQECLLASYEHTEIPVQYIGFPTRSKLPAVIRTFAKDYPDCTIKTSQGKRGQLSTALLNHSATFVITPHEFIDHVKSIHSLPLYNEKHFCVMSSEHPLAEKNTLSISDLDSYPLLTPPEKNRTRHMLRLLQTVHDACPHLRCHNGYTANETIISLLSQPAIAIIPGYFCPVHPQLTIIPLDTNIEIPVVLAYYKKLNAIEKAFAQCIQNHYSSIPNSGNCELP